MTSLTSIFREKASAAGRGFFNLPPVRYVFRHAIDITLAGSAAGHIQLVLKNGLHPSFENAAGACSLAGLAVFKAIERHDKELAFQAVGGFMLLGTGLLAASGLHAGGGDPIKTVLIFGGLAAASLTTALYKNIPGALTASAKALSSVQNLVHLPDMNFAHTAEESFSRITTAVDDLASHHDLGMRIIGNTMLLGTGLATLALTQQGTHDIDWWKLLSPIISFGTTSTLIAFQKDIVALGDRHQNSGNPVVRAAAKVAQHAVMTGAVIDISGVLGLTRSAWNNRDAKLAGVCAAWLVAETGFMAVDSRLQESFEQAQEPITPENYLTYARHGVTKLSFGA